jgi:epoxyqueuosine reductase
MQSAARAAGFDLAGIAPAQDFPELAAFPQWVEQGRAGEMQYLAARDEFGQLKRASLKSAAPWARSVIVCAKNYNTASPRTSHPHEPGSGWISRYAWGDDYHEHLLAALRRVEAEVARAIDDPQLRTWSYVDTGPVIERVFAKYAGIGWLAKNTCVINQQIGSWMFLGVILTSLRLPPSLPAPDRCGTCTRCLEACPTSAFTGPYQLDARRCIAYLTIEKRGEIPEELRDGIGRHVFGCDICQDVCPWNRKAPASTAPEFQSRPGLVNPSLEWLATITEEEFRATFKGSPIKRTKRSGIRRNAVIALGNTGDPSWLPLLEKLAKDEDTVVAEHARWAAAKIRESAALPSDTSWKNPDV